MARRSNKRAGARTRDPLPERPVTIDTGVAEVVRDRTNPWLVTVVVNGVPSSALDLTDATWLDFEYMQFMAAAMDLLPPGPLDAVHLGAGACALPRRTEAVRPGSRQLAVDPDARLLTLVREWFDLPRSPRLRLRAGEGSAVLSGLPDASADVVVRDAFAGDTTPEHLTTVGFLEQVARVLRPGGLYLANCADRPPLALARSETATTAAVLDGVAVMAEPALLKGRRYGNVVIAGQRRNDGAAPLDLHHLERAVRRLPAPASVLHGSTLRAFVGTAPVRRDDAGAAPVTGTAPATDEARIRPDGPSQPEGPSGPG